MNVLPQKSKNTHTVDIIGYKNLIKDHFNQKKSQNVNYEMMVYYRQRRKIKYIIKHS